MIFLLGKPLNSEIIFAFSKSWLTVDAFGCWLPVRAASALVSAETPPAGPLKVQRAQCRQVQDSDPATGSEVRLSVAFGEYR